MPNFRHVRPNSPIIETIRLGPMVFQILSTSSATAHLFLTIAAHTPGFPLHLHAMHQVSFLVLRGNVRFATSTVSSFNANPGDLIEVPVGTSYGFSNPFEEDTQLFVTYAPGYYVDCLRELGKLASGGKLLSWEEQAEVVGRWSTKIVTVGREEGEDDDDFAPEFTGLRCMA